jgi:hypothetical protein
MTSLPPLRRAWLVALTALLVLGSAGPGLTSAQVVDPSATTSTTEPVATTPTVTPDDAPPPTLDPQDLAAPSDADQADGVTYNEQAGGGGGKNVVKLTNRVDGRMRMRGNVQLSRVGGPNVGPVNVAVALSSCTDCSTFAVALQIAVYQRGATRVVPQNAAAAMNANCNHCVTVAHAYQYAIPVDDPNAPPDRVNSLVRRMDEELQGIQRDSSQLTPADAEARIEAVIAEYQDLATNLMQARDERTDGSDAPSPTPTGTLLAPAPATTAAPTATMLGADQPQPTGTTQPGGTVSSTDPSQTTGTVQPATLQSTSAATAVPTSTPVP